MEQFAAEFRAHPEWWFSATPADDAYLSDKYQDLLDIPEEPTADRLAQIMVYDQLPRHVFRRQPAAHIIAFFLQKALTIVRTFPTAPSSSTADFVFWALPLRHTGDPAIIQRVARLAWNYLKSGHPAPDDPELLRRFIKATYERCPRGDQTAFLAPEPPSPAFRAETLIGDPATCQSGPGSGSKATEALNKTFKDFMQQQITIKQKQVILSLSGGVDSMVLFHCLLTTNIPFTAVHINYANRDTADAEHAFLADYTARYNVPFVCRRISEFSRADAMAHGMREIYETYTRDIRFATYRTAATASSAIPVVLLGHHYDDITENILTNIAQKNNYDNLKGMSPVADIASIRFVRPFLAADIPKTVLYEYSASLGIPHFPDSTLAWTQRGQIRNTVLPTLTAWDPRIVGGLHAAANHTSAMYATIGCFVRTLAAIAKAAAELTFAEPHNIPNDVVFWRPFFHTMYGVTVSNKAIQTLQQRLRLIHRYTKTAVPLAKGLSVILLVRKNGIIMRFART